MKMPEARLAEVRRITKEIVKSNSELTHSDIGLWGVMVCDGVIKCHNYQKAADLAAAFNRCPA